MADLVVDVDGLEALVATVKGVQAEMNRTPDLVDAVGEAMGSGDVSGALDHFQSHWHDGRKHLNNSADTMTSMLGESAQAYRRTDDQLAGSAQTHQTTTQIGGGRAG